METAKQQTATLSIGGMACSGCASTVQQALDNLEGVKEVTVELENESAKVIFDPDVVSKETLGQAVEEAGYKFKEVAN